MWKKISKFQICPDLPTMISDVNVLMRLLTLNIDRRNKTPIPLFAYILTYYCAACYTYGYLISTPWFLFWRCKRICNLAAAMVALSLSVSSVIATMKLVYMVTHISAVRCLVDQYLETDALVEKGNRFSMNIRKVLRIVKIRAICFWICVFSIAVSYIIIPIFLPGRHLPEDFTVLVGLEPAFVFPNFEITYTVIAFSVTFIGYTVSTLTAFNIIIIGYTEAQMISLSEEVLCVWEDSIQDIHELKIEHIFALLENKRQIFDDAAKAQINSGVRKRLINILKIHTRNVALLKKVDKFYNVPNAVAFGCLGVSLIAELLGGLENTYLQVPFTFVQVAMDCYTGQKIMNASTAFEKSIYCCKWEDLDRDNMRIVLLMLQNSQKTMTISAGGMAVMNFICLMSIVRSVYSSYTTLRSMI